MSSDFDKQIIESMRFENKDSLILEEHDDLLLCLHSLNSMMTGRSDRWFCNRFIQESIQLLINSIFLYEDGNFDCAFYSLRQASELTNNMLYLATRGKETLESWNSKSSFPMNAKILKTLEKIDADYSEVKTVLADFFDEHEALIKASHKTIHKQGFDTFYTFRAIHYGPERFNNKNEETRCFLKFLKSCIGKALILFIVVEPLSLLLADEDLSAKLYFDPITDPIDADFFQKYLSADILAKIKGTRFFKDFSGYFADNEKMIPPVYDIVRNQFFDLESLDEIETQKHLLGRDAQIILLILQAKIKVCHIHPDCSFFYYFTSISSNRLRKVMVPAEFAACRNRSEIFNESHHNIFRSIVKILDENWILEHNEALSEQDIIIIKAITKDKAHL